MQKDNCFVLWYYDMRFSGQFSIINAITKTTCKKGFAQCYFRLDVS